MAEHETKPTHSTPKPASTHHEATHEHRRRGTMVGTWDPMWAVGGATSHESATSKQQPLDLSSIINPAHGPYNTSAPVHPDGHRRKGTMMGSYSLPSDW